MMAELSNPEKVRSAESSIRTCQLPGVTIWGEHWFSRGIMSDRGEDPRPSSPYRLSPHAKSALYDPRAPAATPSAAEAAAHAPTRRRPRPPAPAPPIPRAAPRGVGATPRPPPSPPVLSPPPGLHHFCGVRRRAWGGGRRGLRQAGGRLTAQRAAGTAVVAARAAAAVPASASAAVAAAPASASAAPAAAPAPFWGSAPRGSSGARPLSGHGREGGAEEAFDGAEESTAEYVELDGGRPEPS